MLTATLDGRPESTTLVLDIAPRTKQAVFPLLRPGRLNVRGVIYENGAFLSHWASVDFPTPITLTAEQVGSDLTITWTDWPELVESAYRGVELVLTA